MINDLNVIFVLIDALRADHVSCYGYERKTTPNIDKLAENGLLFSNAITQAPNTKPAITSIFTGLYPATHKVRQPIDVLDARESKDYYLNKKFSYLPKILQENGYKTIAFSGNPHIKKVFGYGDGFDEFITVSMETRASEINELFLEKLKGEDKKVFAYLHLMDVHNPYNPPKKYKKYPPFEGKDVYQTGIISEKISQNDLDYTIARYDEEINYVDDCINELVIGLKKATKRNYLIVIMADHGDSFLEHDALAHWVGPYEELIKVPIIFHCPGVIPSKKENRIVESIGIMPSILSVLGIPIPQNIQGKDLTQLKDDHKEVAFIENTQTDERISTFFAAQKAVRTKDWKLIQWRNEFNLKFNSRLAKDIIKFLFNRILKRESFGIFFRSSNGEELYDLRVDPKEQKNLIEKEPEKAKELRELLIRWEKQQKDYSKNLSISSTTAIDDKTKQQLRSLGYLT